MKSNSYVFIGTMTMLCSCGTLANIESAFEEHDIVPDIMTVAPARILNVTYPSGHSAHLGNVLTPTQVKDKPEVWWDAEKNALYTLVMVDVDMPARLLGKQYFEVRHWVVINIPGSSVEKGDEIIEYLGAAPLKFTGFHRILILVYKQLDGYILHKDSSRSRRRGIPHRLHVTPFKFVEKYKLGNPEFGNFYQVKHDGFSNSLLLEVIRFN